MSGQHYVQDVSFQRRVPRDDLVHHLMGNRHLQAMVQITENLSARNALVLHLMHPERFRPKSGSFTFHQQLGPEFTTVRLFHAGQLYGPHPRQAAHDLQYGLSFEGGASLFRAAYPADFTVAGERAKTPFTVEEQIFCPPGLAAVLRRVRVVNNRGREPAPARLFAFLVPNQNLFPEAHYLTAERAAVAGHFKQGAEFLAFAAHGAEGDHQVAMFPTPFDDALNGRLGDLAPSSDDATYVQPEAAYTNYPLLPGSPHLGPVMALEFDLGDLAAGAAATVDLIYAYGESERAALDVVQAARERSFEDWRAADRTQWQSANSLTTGDGRLDDFYAAARAALRASVGLTGRMDACIWGFNSEWVRDSSLACVGAIHSGQFDVAKAMLEHILSDLTDPSGTAFGESHFYSKQHAEPDQNGELLWALWLYWVHARDDSLLRAHWDRIIAVAEFPLGPDYWVEAANMIQSERDIRERNREMHGMELGFELAYQMWVSLGLGKAAQMADHLGEAEHAARWRDYAGRLWHAALNHPQFRLVEDNYLMKRRGPDGEFQRFAQANPYIHRVYDDVTRLYPRCLYREGALEPDHSEAYPIALGMIDPDSDLAFRTLTRMEELWNQEWDFGGYPLHNADSEPTKLGAHLLPIQLITQAALEARHYDTARRNIDWLLNIKDGRGYTWWEYRDADPKMQIDHGIPPWFGFAEPLVMFVYHLIGYRPQPAEIHIQPHLLPELKTVGARVRSGAHWINLRLHNGGRRVVRATVDGQAWDRLTPDRVTLDVPTADVAVEIWLEE